MRYGRLAGAVLAAIVLSAGAAAAQQAAPSDSAARPAAARHRSRMHAYVHDIGGRGAWLGVGTGSTIEQVRHTPAAWGTNVGGFGERLASSAGDLVVQESVRHGLAALMGRSTDYHRCDDACTSFGARVRHGFDETFTDEDAAGRHRFSVARVGGAVAGGFAPMLWMPGATVASSAATAGVSLLLTAAGNVLTEYFH